jgi:hypothetical protein
MMSDKLHLRATDPEDLAVISACLQDARISLKEMVFTPAERRFLAAFVRFRRELQDDWQSCAGLTECDAALVFEDVAEVKHRGLDLADLDRPLELLTIATSPGREHRLHIDLVFAGDRQVQLRTDRIECRLDDFGEPVASRTTPCDHLGAEWIGSARS